jgi:ketosteroid isomerase-like protein
MTAPEPDWAQAFAEAWVAAWNSGDIDRIFSHYRDDFEMRTPFIAEQGFSVDGVLRGKDAIRHYWGPRLAAQPPIRFELIKAFSGVGGVAILYHNLVRRKLVIERIELDEAGLGIRAEALYVDDDGTLG